MNNDTIRDITSETTNSYFDRSLRRFIESRVDEYIKNTYANIVDEQIRQTFLRWTCRRGVSRETVNNVESGSLPPPELDDWIRENTTKFIGRKSPSDMSVMPHNDKITTVRRSVSCKDLNTR